jgi:hypothetical protein
MVRMPVTIWNLLPENGAYSFVGFVTSENLAYDNPRSAYNDSRREEDPADSPLDTPQGSDDWGEILRYDDMFKEAVGGDVMSDEHEDIYPEIMSRLNLNQSTTKSTPDASIITDSEPHIHIPETPRTETQVQEASASSLQTSPLSVLPRSTDSSSSISSPPDSSVARSTSNLVINRNSNSMSSRRTLMDLGAEVATTASSIVPSSQTPIHSQEPSSAGGCWVTVYGHGPENLWTWYCVGLFTI